MSMFFLAGILILLIFLSCGDKGVRSIVSTALSLLIMLAAIFLIYRGLPPAAVTLGACALITGAILYYQNEHGTMARTAFCSVMLVLVIMILAFNRETSTGLLLLFLVAEVVLIIIYYSSFCFEMRDRKGQGKNHLETLRQRYLGHNREQPGAPAGSADDQPKDPGSL